MHEILTSLHFKPFFFLLQTRIQKIFIFKIMPNFPIKMKLGDETFLFNIVNLVNASALTLNSDLLKVQD